MTILATAPGRTEPIERLLERLKTVDGAGSGLVADMLDGKHAAAFQTPPLTATDNTALSATVDWNNYTQTGFYRGNDLLNQTPFKANTWQYTLVINHNNSYCTQIAVGFGATDGLSFRNRVNDVWTDWKPIWSGQGLLGEGSNLDADTVDGQHAAAFAAASHGHPISEVADLQTSLDGKAASIHGHGISEVTDLQTALDSKEAAFTKNTAFNKNFGTTSTTVCQGNDARLSDARTPTTHNHPISEVTDLQTALDGKAAADHNHAIADVTDLQTALDGKAATTGTGSNAFQIGVGQPAPAGTLEAGQATPAGTDVLGYNGYFYATRVYNAYLADYADFIILAPDCLQVYGKTYKMTSQGATICQGRCEKGVLGVASDVYGHALGQIRSRRQIPIGVAGWVLAYCDRQYQPGTALTTGKDGSLTKMRWYEKLFWPERMVGVYMQPEKSKFWGPLNHQVAVNGRHWVKVA